MEYQNHPCFLLAKRNLELANRLLKATGGNYDWVVTILYYSVLMYAQCLFGLSGWPIPSTHRTHTESDGREKLGWNHAIGDKLGKNARINFDTLYRASRKYRYDPKEALALGKQTTSKYLEFYKIVMGIIKQELDK